MDTLASLKAALGDRYQVERVVGQGGMATVYLAHDVRHSSRVAVKVLRPELAALTGGLRFTREIQITASLQHPNILPLLDSGEANGIPYYVMPFVEGESLAHRLERETRLPLDEAVRLLAQVADGLAHAHARGFVHRDIKPANILLSHGHAIIADFGVARALISTGAGRITDSGMAIGTAAYMSPEQAGSESIDGRSDIYSLGCVLYEVLSGTPPFTGPTAQAIMARNAVDPVPSIRTLRQSVPQALEGVINKALAKVPEDRFSSAGEFRDALLHAATMPVTIEAPRRLTRKRRVGWALAVVTLLAVTAVALKLTTASPALDPNRVMVFPLLLPGDWRGSSTAGEDVATIIGSAMDGAGSLRWVDGWRLLKPAQRDDIRTLGIREAMALARSQGCAFALTGKLVAQGDSALVFLELYDIRDGSVVRAPAQTAAITESWRGGMAGITAILPRLIGSVALDVESEWKARPPQAVAHFLLGESAFRRVKLAAALAEFRKALEADSTFGFAALRGAQVASWNHLSSQAAALIRAASRTRLSPRYQHFASGFLAYLDGRADSAAAGFRAALALDSTMVVAWMQLGEVYIHLLPTEGRGDSLAEAAFVRARALDSTAITQQFHLIEILARRGESATAAELARQFVRTAADTQLSREVTLVSACDAGVMTGINLRAEAVQHPLALLLAAKSLGASRFTAGCARAGFEALLREDTSGTTAADSSRRFFALVGQFNGLAGRAEATQAVRAIERFRLRWGDGRSLYLLAAPVMPALADSARAVARQDSIDAGADYAGIRSTVRLWKLGVWAAVEGKSSVAAAVARRLAARAQTGTRADSLLAGSMAAHAALARGDSVEALRRLEALVAAPAPVADLAWNEAASTGYDRVMMGRLLISPNPARALRVLDVLDSALPAVFPLYLRRSLLLRADAAMALGQRGLAEAFQARVTALSGR